MVIVIGSGVFFLYQKMMRPRNLIIPSNEHHGSAYVRDIFLPKISSEKMNKGATIPSYFHLEPPPSDYVWARRVISASHKSLVRLSSGSEDWKMN